MDAQFEGGCRCGAVRFTLKGEPTQVGLCHCTTCRKETGGPFLYYADWAIENFAVTGSYSTYDGRSFCPQCGSALFHPSDDHVEVALGSLDDAPVALAPQKEGWIRRREPWLVAVVGADQFRQDTAGTWNIPRTGESA